MKRMASILALSAAVFATTQAQAVTITFGGQAATDGSGLTSKNVPSSNVPLVASSGYFIETFDIATRNPFFPALALPTDETLPGVAIGNAGCDFNSRAGGVTISSDIGGAGITTGSSNVSAAPAGDTTCYGYGPGPANPAGGNATVTVDFSGLLALLGQNHQDNVIKYLGIYYGSIDSYNDLHFGNVVNGHFQQTSPTSQVTGQDILNAMNGTSGDQFGAGSNVYVNMYFSDAEAFSAIQFHTTAVAFEVDNIVVGMVPEPGSVALFGLGLAALVGVAKRRKQVK